MKIWIWAAGVSIGLAAVSSGCGMGDINPDETSGVEPNRKAFDGWPADNLTAPDFSGSVERVAEKLPDDVETGRIPAFHMVPDWAEPVSPIEYRLPKGARLEWHLFKRNEQLRQQDNATLRKLQAGTPMPNKFPITARPWRGWYGESNGSKTRIRIYNLFQEERFLEIKLEWMQGDLDALREGEDVVRHLIHSIQVLQPNGA